MEQEKIFDDISNLPPEAQRQVVDFIAFLRTRYKRSEQEKQESESQVDTTDAKNRRSSVVTAKGPFANHRDIP